MQNSRGWRKRRRLEKENPRLCSVRLFTKIVCKQGFMLFVALLCLPRASNKPQQNRCVWVIFLNGNARSKGRMQFIYPNPHYTEWELFKWLVHQQIKVMSIIYSTNHYVVPNLIIFFPKEYKKVIWQK